MAKGGKYEREICKLLSLWWTGDQRDDVFWRTSNSGGRATVRSKKRKRTAGQYGDVGATDPIGKPLLDYCTIEIKRGYNADTPMILMDQRPHRNPCRWELWIEQCLRESKEARSPTWLLIYRRDQGEAMVCLSDRFYSDMASQYVRLSNCRPYLRMKPSFRKLRTQRCKVVHIMRLSDFLERVSAPDIVDLT